MSRYPVKRPPAIEYALERIALLVSEPHRFGEITYSRPGKPRLMREERRRNMQKVLTVLIRHVDLVTGRVVRPLGHTDNIPNFADCSLSWLCHAAGVSKRTLCRVLCDLVGVGWLDRSAQKIIAVDDDTLAVATVIRSLTDRFFVALGVGKDFVRDKIILEGRRRAKKVITLFRLVGRTKKVLQKREERPRCNSIILNEPMPGGVDNWLKQQQEEAHASWWARFRSPT